MQTEHHHYHQQQQQRHRQLDQWVLELGTDGSNKSDAMHVKEVARYALSSYESYVEVLTVPGLLNAVVTCLVSAAQQNNHQLADTALSTLKVLTTTQQGSQAVIQADGVNAICEVLPDLASSCPCMDHRQKRHCHDPDQDDITGAHSVMTLATELLALLMLDCSAKLEVGSLNAGHATGAFNAMQQVISGMSQEATSPTKWQDAAAVLARLAMEPMMAQHIMQQQQHDCPAWLCSNNGDSREGSKPKALEDLLGGPSAAETFLQQHWQQQPLCWHAAKATNLQPDNCLALQGTEQWHKLQLQQASRDMTLSDAAGSSALLQQIATQLPVGTVHWRLASWFHCPVMGVEETDPVQYLATAHKEKLLLQPLRPNEDIRLIKVINSTNTASKQAFQNDTSTSTAILDEPEGASSIISTSTCAAVEHLFKNPSGMAATAASAAAALQRGYSLVVRDIAKRIGAVASLVDALEQQLGLPAGANLYLTPPGQQGLQAHYDDHCVFVLQLAGSKAWLVGPPEHGELPLTYQPRLPVSLLNFSQLCCHQQQQQQQQQHPDDDHQQQHAEEQQGHQLFQQSMEQQPQQQLQQQPGVQQQVQQQQSGAYYHQLVPGSCLYIPRGWVHQAVALGDAPAPSTQAIAGPLAPPPAAAVAREAAAVLAGEAAAVAAGTPDTEAAKQQCATPGSSLHLSVGVEVEARWCMQGFMHFLIEYSTLQVILAEQDSCIGLASCGQPCDCVGSFVQLQEGHHNSNHNMHCNTLFQQHKEQGTAEAATAATIAPAAADAAAEAAALLAKNTAAVLLHVVLWQRAQQQPALRTACPLLVKDTSTQAMMSAAVTKQLTAGLSTQGAAIKAPDGCRLCRSYSSKADHVCSFNDWIHAAKCHAFGFVRPHVEATAAAPAPPAPADVTLAATPAGSSQAKGVVGTKQLQHLLQLINPVYLKDLLEQLLQPCDGTQWHADPACSSQQQQQQRNLYQQHQEVGQQQRQSAVAGNVGSPHILDWMQMAHESTAAAASHPGTDPDSYTAQIMAAATEYTGGMGQHTSSSSNSTAIKSTASLDCLGTMWCWQRRPSAIAVLALAWLGNEVHTNEHCDQDQEQQQEQILHLVSNSLLLQQHVSCSMQGSCGQAEHNKHSSLDQTTAVPKNAGAGAAASPVMAPHVQQAVSQLPAAAEALMQCLQCDGCTAYAVSAYCKQAEQLMDARRAVRYAHLALHSVFGTA